MKSEKKDRHRSRSRSQERDYSYSKQKDKYRDDFRVRDWDKKADRNRSPKKSKGKERSKYRWRIRKRERELKCASFQHSQHSHKWMCTYWIKAVAFCWQLGLTILCRSKPWCQKGGFNKVFHVSGMVWVSNKECCLKLLGNISMH